MLQVLESNAQTIATAAPVAGTGVDVKKASGAGVMLVVTNSAPAAGTFTAAVTDICTKTAHGYLTGLKVRCTTTTTLPAGLSLATDYFVIKIDANTFKLASSLVNAQAGTAVDITDTGTGTHTITPTALAGGSIKLQGSMDDSNYADIPISASGDVTKTVSVTATSVLFLKDENPLFNYIRPYVTLTAGQLSIVATTLVKGE